MKIRLGCSTDIITNLIQDKVRLSKELEDKETIIEELKFKILDYERRLLCQKSN